MKNKHTVLYIYRNAVQVLTQDTQEMPGLGRLTMLNICEISDALILSAIEVTLEYKTRSEDWDSGL